MVWTPTFRDDTPLRDVETAMRLMVRHMAVARRAAGPTHLGIESRSGDDEAHNDLWLRTLRAEGYTEASVYRAHVLALDRSSPAAVPPDGVSIRPIEATEQQILLADLYRRLKSDTLEPRSINLAQPAAALEEKRAVGRGMNAATWLVAWRAGTPVGYALANIADAADFDGASAWLVDIGCVPGQRRIGIGSALLAEIVRRLQALGVRRLLAAVDDVNVPSLRLHASLGFEPQEAAHYIYRLGACPGGT